MSILMKDLCNVHRQETVKNSLKVVSSVWKPVYENLKCKFVQNSSTLVQEEKAMITNTYSLYLMSGIDIREGDIIEVKGQNYRASRPYILKTHIKVTCTEEGAL